MKQAVATDPTDRDPEFRHRRGMDYPKPIHLFLFTAFSVFAGEVIVMLILAIMPPLSLPVEALADGFMLTLLATPFLYLFLFRPMVLHIAERSAAEEALRRLNHELEERVTARTADLALVNERLKGEVEERIQAELSLKKSNDFIQRVVEAAPCLLLIFDVNTSKCTFVNGSVTELLGFTPEEVHLANSRFFTKILSAEDLVAFTQLTNDLVVGKESVVRTRLNLKSATGEPRLCRARLTIFSTTPAGEPKELLLSATESET